MSVEAMTISVPSIKAEEANIFAININASDSVSTL